MFYKKFHILICILSCMVFHLAGTSYAQKPVTVTKIETLGGKIDTSGLSTTAPVTVRFLRGAGRYAFDEGAEGRYKRSVMLSKYYEPFGAGYTAPWKLVPTGKSDRVEAYATGSGTAFDRGKVRFALKDGTEIPARDEEGKWTLTLPGVGKGETYEVFALYETGKGKYATAGKLNVVSYPEQRHTVTLVEVGGESPQAASLQDRLNGIYNSYGISFTVRADRILKGDTSWDADGDGRLDIRGSGFFTNETGEMKALRRLYQSTPGSLYARDGYYLFVAGKASAGGEPDESFAVQGDMPRGKQFGYLFTSDASDAGRLAAHELGHGIFTLPHTFDVNLLGNDSKGQTQNLMDYGDGIELAVWQWNVMANPAPLTWFDDDDDAMLAGKIWFSPDWRAFSFDASKTIADYPSTVIGTVPGIYFKGIPYQFRDGNYFNESGGRLEIDWLDLSGKGKTTVYLYGEPDDDCVTPTYTTTYEYAIGHKDNIDYADAANVKFAGNWVCPDNTANKAYRIISSDTSQTLTGFIRELKDLYDRLLEFYDRCDSRQWEPGKQPGIIPKCFWENSDIPWFSYYSPADLPFMAGTIDGGYAEIKGLYDLGVLLTSGSLEEKINEIAYAYTFAYLFCKDESIRLDKEEYESLLEKLSALQSQKDAWSWLQGKFVQLKADDLTHKVTRCENAVKLREDIDEALTEIKDIITNFDEIQRLAGDLKEKLSAYFDLVTNNTNEGRYEAGRLVMPVISLIVPASKITGAGKTKNLLKGARELSEKEADDLAQKLISKGNDVGIIQRIDGIFDLSKFKKLTNRIPTGKNLTNLKKAEFMEYGYRVKPTSGGLKTKIDDIITNGDNFGTKTESIIDDLMRQNGYTKLNGKYRSNNGYDGVFIKGPVDNPIEIIIIESKQFRYINGAADDIVEHSGVVLNPPSGTTSLPAQMSDEWIIFVAKKLEEAGNINVANLVRDNPGLIQKYVSAVDKTQGEINFLKLGNYE